MMHTLAQSGGGNWLSPGAIKGLAFLVFILVSLLGQVFKKINEKKAKYAAEQARELRREEQLRTGRDETGAFAGSGDRPQAQVQSQSQESATADDARRKLQELAERRRRELAEAMRRSPQGGNAPARPGAQAPARKVPPMIAGTPTPPSMRPPQPRPAPGGSTFAPRQPATEREVRRGREDQSNRKAAQQAAARRKAQEQQPLRPEVAPYEPIQASSTPTAYQIAPTGATAPDTSAQRSAASKVSAVMARITGTSNASEWRKAVILGELLQKPISMREPDARAF
jgi:hypothetical protein